MKRDIPKNAAKARPRIEQVAAALRQVAAKIGDLPVTSRRDALLFELNSIIEAIGDLVARLPTARSAL